MPRRPRHDIEGGVHHVMNRGVNRQRTFFADVDRVEFGRRLADIHQRFGVETLAYCLMSNHYHLVLHAPRGGLGDAMHHLGLVYTRRTNVRVGRDGPLFRGRYHSIPVTTDRYLLTAVGYVHRNALDIAGVERPSDYRWSSCRAYLGLRPRADFLNTDIVLSFFGDDPLRFAEFANDAGAGSSDVGLAHSLPPTGVDDLVQLVRFAGAVDDIVNGDDSTRLRPHERTALMLVADRLSSSPLGRELAESFDFPTPDARRMAIARCRRRAADPAVARIVTRVLDAVAPHQRAA